MKRLLSIFLLIFAISAWCEENTAFETIHFTGTVTDSVFKEDADLHAEIIETGDVRPIRYGTPFELDLPADSIWNLCIYGKTKEKCYEVYYAGKDSAFSFEVSSEALMTRYEDGEESRVPASAFTDLTSEPEEDLDVAELLKGETASSVTELKKVVVQLRRKPKRKMGQSVVSAKSMKRMPGLAEADVMRSIQALPGVVASSDFSTKIYVRGGGSDQNLFLLDNGVVYSPNHFFGLFSTFLVEAIDDVNFYKSGFPPQYGNRLSSVLDMHSRQGGNDTLDEWFSKSSLKISTFAAQAHTEGHQGDFSWILAGRTTYIKQMLDLFNALGMLDFSIDYRFTDLQGALKYEFGEGRELQFSFYTGADVLDFDPIYLDWGNVVLPLNFKWRFNTDWESQTTFSYTKFYQTMKLSDLMTIKNDIHTFAFKEMLLYRGLENHTFAGGYELDYSDVVFYEKFMDNDLEDHPRPILHSLFLGDTWELSPRLSLQYGLRGNYQNLVKLFGVEPRFSANFKIDDTKNVEFYAGRYLQFLNSIMFSDQESLNEFYYPSVTQTDGTKNKPSSSWLFSLGYMQRNIFDRFSGSAEVYYKTLDNLTTFTNVSGESDSENEDFVIADYFGTAEGYSFGYEISLRKDEGAFFGGVSWSQGMSVISDHKDEVVYYPNWHQPYSLKIDLGINWRGDEDAIWGYKNKRGRYLRSSFVLKYASGMPVTDRIGYFKAEDLYPSKSDEEFLVIQGQRNMGRQSDYFRLDAKLLDIGVENKWNFSWTIINVTDHENIFSYTYDTSKNPPELNKVAQFPFLPVMVSYEYYF